MVGAELEESIKASLFESFADKKRELKTEDILEEFKKTVPISVSMKDQLEDLWKWCRDGKVRYASTQPIAEGSNRIGFTPGK